MACLRPSRRFGGFSLVEVMLVLAITAVIAGIAMPRYHSSLANFRVDSAARRLRADLILARDTARQRSQAISVTFTSGAQSQYILTGIRDPDRPALTDCTVALWREPYQATFGTLSAGGDAVLVFDGYGVPDSSASIVVRAGALTRTVTVEAATGDIRVSTP